MQKNVDIHIFDPKARTTALKRARKSFNHHNFLHKWADQILADRLEDVNREFENAVQIGNLFKDSALKRSKKIKNIFTLDNENADIISSYDTPPLKTHGLDLISSLLNLHSINDLPGTLIQIRRALKPDGLFLAAMLGGETLYELRESLQYAELELKGGVSPRIFPFADKPQMGALLQRAGFALPVVDSEILTVTYDDIFKLMRDIRGMGEGNVITQRNPLNPGKNLFFKANEYYKSHYVDNSDRIIASFEIIFLIGWAPHESQQQPLKPGSADARLAEALETKEIKAGETP
ncbi:MAG: methyltransferase domain-containing protein [Pseudomonadota bacterium]